MTLRRLIAWAGIAAAMSYLAACGYMWSSQTQQVFEPSPEIQTTPARLGMPFEELRIPVGSAELHGWWIPAEQPGAVTILYFHGNYRNISHNLDHVRRLHDLGYNVMLADYRGYGKSTGGPPTEAKVYEDAEAAWQYMLKVRGIHPRRAFIYGHSLGGAVAIDLATRHPDAAGLIAESTFTSMQAMGELEYGYLPVGALLNQRFDSLQKIATLKLPVLLIHGTWDRRVPVAMAQLLYAAALQPKALTLIEGGEHGNSGMVGWIEYRDAVSAFVGRYAR
ncbi:MAG TPA: alpha/beta hydrolase [Gallionella sp.]|nr:alpha/beta hydrolase [Gallionella sp.]